MYPGVYRMAGAPATWRQSLLAACLWWGDGAAISHCAAAALWRLLGFAPGGAIELSLGLRRQRRAARHRVHRPASLDAVDVTTLDRIPVTTVARTLIDVAGCVPADVLEEALDDALRRQLVTVARLRRRLDVLGGPGRRGTGLLRGLVDARAAPRRVPQSVFETRLLRVLRTGGLPRPALQHSVTTHLGKAVLDFAYVERRVAVEADGFRWHSSRRQWDHDRMRRNALTMLGWTLVHVTWPELRDRPGEVAEAIRATLSR